MNLLSEISRKSIFSTKKINMKVSFSFCYNTHIFPYEGFENFMACYGINVWHVTPQYIRKNKELYES